MTIDQLLSRFSQLQSIVALNQLPHTPLSQELKNYIMALHGIGKTKATLTAYSQFIGYFIHFLVDNKLETEPKAITQNHILFYLVTLRDRCDNKNKKLTPETINTYYRALHTFFNWLKAKKTIEVNPFEGLTAPKIPKKHVKGYAPDIIDRLLLTCGSNRTLLGLRDYAILLMFLDTGIRRGEMANIKLTDIIPDQSLIKVMGKGEKERIVKMGDGARNALATYLTLRSKLLPDSDKEPALWIDRYGKPVSLWGIQSIMRRITARANIPSTIKHGAHALRHTAATSYLRNGGNVKCLQELLGHTDIKTTMKYVDALGTETMIQDHKKASPVDNLFGKVKR